MKGRFTRGVILLILVQATYCSHPVISQNFDDTPCTREVFSFKMISPNDNLIMNNIASLEQNEFPKGCISVDVHLSINSLSYSSRSINYNVSDIPTKRVPLFDDGGYDLTFYLGNTTNNSSELFQYFHSQQTIDIGKNWYNYQNSTLDGLLEQYPSETNITVKKEVAYQIQRILHEDVPSVVIAANDNSWYEIVLNNLHPVFGTGSGTPSASGYGVFLEPQEAARYVRQAIAHLIPYDVIISELFGGNAKVIPTRWMPNWEFYDNSLQPYNYSIATAKELLTKAGFPLPCGEPGPVGPTETQIKLGVIFTWGLIIVSAAGIFWLIYQGKFDK